MPTRDETEEAGAALPEQAPIKKEKGLRVKNPQAFFFW
jgi:hypothetical protein